jgi:hypothetical protein
VLPGGKKKENTQPKKVDRVAQVVQCLPSKCEALNSIPGTAKKRKKKKIIVFFPLTLDLVHYSAKIAPQVASTCKHLL